MLLRNHPDRIHVAFDDHHLVASELFTQNSSRPEAA